MLIAAEGSAHFDAKIQKDIGEKKGQIRHLDSIIRY